MTGKEMNKRNKHERGQDKSEKIGEKNTSKEQVCQ